VPAPGADALVAALREIPARDILLPAGDDIAEASSLVHEHGLGGLAVPAAALPDLAARIEHRFQVRRRVWDSP
jgi:hypothetical protein